MSDLIYVKAFNYLCGFAGESPIHFNCMPPRIIKARMFATSIRILALACVCVCASPAV